MFIVHSSETRCRRISRRWEPKLGSGTIREISPSLWVWRHALWPARLGLMRKNSLPMSLALVLCASLTFAGCGGSGGGKKTSDGTDTEDDSKDDTEEDGKKSSESGAGKGSKTGTGSGQGDKTNTSGTGTGKGTGTKTGTGKGSKTGTGTGTGKDTGTKTGTGTKTSTGTGTKTGTGGSAGSKFNFNNHIKPIIVAGCGCHTSATPKTPSLDASTAYKTLMTGKAKDGTPYVTKNDLSKSNFFQVIVSKDDKKRMPKPPRSALSADKVRVIKEWIEGGAPES